MTTQKTNTAAERMKSAGLTIEELRVVVAGVNVAGPKDPRRDEFLARMRDAGLSLEQAKEIIKTFSDDNSGGGGTVSDRVL